jgi:hypothetical protein
MRVDVSPEAAGLVLPAWRAAVGLGAPEPRVCCTGTPAYMHAATERPPGLPGFSLVPHAGVEIWFRAPAGRVPDVLEIGVRGQAPAPRRGLLGWLTDRALRVRCFSSAPVRDSLPATVGRWCTYRARVVRGAR